MSKKIFFGVFLCTVVLILGLADCSLAGSDWKEEQVKLFSEISVKPGDTVDSSNWEKVKDVLPPQVADWVKKGDMIVKVGEMKYDYDTDSGWKAATVKNEGKYDLDENLEIRDKATGKIPTYIYGEPFPNLDVAKDPNGAIKLAHNLIVARGRSGNQRSNFGIDWLSREAGCERSLYADLCIFHYYACPGGERQNHSGYHYLEFTNIKEPNDLEGMVTLTKRYLDSRPDDFYAYVPTIRRVKRLSGASRSDPFAGSDFVNDIETGWAGKNTSMKWKCLNKKIILIPVAEKDAERPVSTTKMPNGAWRLNPEGESILAGHEVQGSKVAPWIPVNVVWVPRMMYVLEATPVDPYYNFGKYEMYVDPGVGFCYDIIFDKAFTYWKTIVNIPICADWGDGPTKNRTFSSSSVYFCLDEKTNHGGYGYFFGTHQNHDFPIFYNDPTLTERDFAEGNISGKSR
ncbi:MAG: DUF1329 domain-containing protein [Syntrophobacteraceae bacterium]